MLPGYVDKVTGDLVKETLESIHLEGREDSIESLPKFESYPELNNILGTEDNVEIVLKKSLEIWCFNFDFEIDFLTSD